MEYKVLAIKPYDFTDKEGRKIKGCNLFYLDQPETSSGAKGYLPIKVGLPYEMLERFTIVPGVYKFDFGFRPDSKGKPIMVIKWAEFVTEWVI